MLFGQLSKIVEPKVISVFEEVGFELDKKNNPQMASAL